MSSKLMEELAVSFTISALVKAFRATKAVRTKLCTALSFPVITPFHSSKRELSLESSGL